MKKCRTFHTGLPGSRLACQRFSNVELPFSKQGTSESEVLAPSAGAAEVEKAQLSLPPFVDALVVGLLTVQATKPEDCTTAPQHLHLND